MDSSWESKAHGHALDTANEDASPRDASRRDARCVSRLLSGSRFRRGRPSANADYTRRGYLESSYNEPAHTLPLSLSLKKRTPMRRILLSLPFLLLTLSPVANAQTVSVP